MESVTKANVPASSVEPYAIPAVIASSFPASEPRSAIPGIRNDKSKNDQRDDKAEKVAKYPVKGCQNLNRQRQMDGARQVTD